MRLDTLPERRGKAATLNRVVPTLTSEVLVFSDGNTFTEPDSVRKLARWFVDPSIGVVCGKLVLVDSATGHNVDGLYWRIETALKDREAQLGAINGVNGAIYALRRTVFSPLPAGTILDDLVLPLRSRLATGCRLLFDPEAVAFEETAVGVDAEFNRRARIGAGGFQALALLWPLLDPRQGGSPSRSSRTRSCAGPVPVPHRPARRQHSLGRPAVVRAVPGRPARGARDRAGARPERASGAPAPRRSASPSCSTR